MKDTFLKYRKAFVGAGGSALTSVTLAPYGADFANLLLWQLGDVPPKIETSITNLCTGFVTFVGGFLSIALTSNRETERLES